MLHILLTGTLYETPVERTAKNGNLFATAKVLADVDDGSAIWCNVIAFSLAGERLALLQAGDAVSMTGKARLQQWEDQNGNPRAGLAVTATEIIVLARASEGRIWRRRVVPFQTGQGDELNYEAIPFDDDLCLLDTETASSEIPASAVTPTPAVVAVASFAPETATASKVSKRSKPESTHQPRKRSVPPKRKRLSKTSTLQNSEA